jgi:hypothetical protein
MRHVDRRLAWILLGCLTVAAPGFARADDRGAVDAVVADYIGLYAGPTLERWRTLFHPAVVVAFPADDGSITTRGLDENVRVDMGRRVARVSADFIFLDEGEKRPGQLGLHLVEGKDGWKIVAVVFSYDAM